jgi:hypothetical protein
VKSVVKKQRGLGSVSSVPLWQNRLGNPIELKENGAARSHVFDPAGNRVEWIEADG